MSHTSQQPHTTIMNSAELAGAIYTGSAGFDSSEWTEKIPGVTSGSSGTQIGVIFRQGHLKLVFPGTETWEDVLADAQISSIRSPVFGTFVSGFWKGVEGVFKDSIFRYMEMPSVTKITLIGHSLGASHAMVVALMIGQYGRLVDSLILFAPPKTCDLIGVQNVHRVCVKVRAYKNYNDPIPFWPKLIDVSLAQFNLDYMKELPRIDDHECEIDRLTGLEYHKMKYYIRGYRDEWDT